jgi:hypothetical protein
MSNRRKLRRPPRVCPECAAGRHPAGPHCGYCGVPLDATGRHPAPICPGAAAALAGHGEN